MTQERVLTANPAAEVQALIFGLPHSVTYEVAHQHRARIAETHGECNLVSLNEPREVVQHYLNQADVPLVLFTDSPDPEIITFAQRTNSPLIAAPIDFGAACQEFLETRNDNLLETLRIIAMAQVGCWHLLDIARSIELQADTDPPHLTNYLRERRADAAAGNCHAGAPEQPEAAKAGELAEIKRDPAAHLAIAELASFYGAPHMKLAHKLPVPIGILTEGTAPYGTTNGRFDLVGPARCLTFGPFLYLPAGRWKANFEFEITGNQTVNSLRFDVIADGGVATKKVVDLRQSGKFRFSDTFDIGNPWLPVEFRTLLDKGAIDGQLTLTALHVERM